MGNLGSTNQNFAGLVGTIVGLFNAVIPLLLGVCIALFFVGLIRYLWESGDAKGHYDGKELIMWGLLSMFVLVSIWGILAFLKTSIFPS